MDISLSPLEDIEEDTYMIYGDHPTSYEDIMLLMRMLGLFDDVMPCRDDLAPFGEDMAPFLGDVAPFRDDFILVG
jgi:hypothetical protein